MKNFIPAYPSTKAMAEIAQELQNAVNKLNRAANPLGARLAMLELQAKEIELQASKSSV